MLYTCENERLWGDVNHGKLFQEMFYNHTEYPD